MKFFAGNVARLLPAAFLSLAAARAFAADALENYVRREDGSFKWEVVHRVHPGGASLDQLQLTSQTWHDHVWQHDLLILRPEKVRNPDIAFLFITGDGDGKKYLGLLKTLADSAGAVAAIVTRVPKQPLYEGRREDSLIAYSFGEYLKSGDETWPLLFPMVKSAVRAMDAVAQHTQQETGQKVGRFVLSGASKRGWTTWLTAAVDPRVAGMAPMVIDTLNMKAQLAWAEKMYGKQSEKIDDYTRMGFDRNVDDPAMARLRDWVDPYSYRARYTMPKLILLGTNDPYWVVDSLRNYWNDLPGPKLVFQTPNAGHDLNGGKEATPALAAFFQMIADRQETPRLDWQVRFSESGAKLSIQTNQKAKAIRLWTAESSDRDFRNEKWRSRDLEIQPGSSTAEVQVEMPATGFRAFLGEVELTSPTGETYKLSTEARVTPDNVGKR
jgi:PhoPQ-activated pathogenicity-related protein